MRTMAFLAVYIATLVGCSTSNPNAPASQYPTYTEYIEGLQGADCPYNPIPSLSPETHICRFVPGRTLYGDFSKAEQRSIFIQKFFANTCKQIEILSESRIMSDDSPPRPLIRVGVRCLQ